MTSEPIPRDGSSHLVPLRPEPAGTNPKGTSSPRPSPEGGDEVPGTTQTHQLAPTSSPDASHRYPLQPLADAAGIHLGVIGAHRPGDPLAGLTALATRLGTSVSTLKRQRTNGLTLAQADHHAITLGHLPHEIWPNWFDDLEGDEPLHGTAATNDLKTTCPAGHPYDRINNRGHRTCSTCHNHQARWYRARHKHQAAA